jgi:hypothetical protein
MCQSNVTDASKGNICANNQDPNVVFHDPNHSISGVNFQCWFTSLIAGAQQSLTIRVLVFGTFHPDEAVVKKGPAEKVENMMG